MKNIIISAILLTNILNINAQEIKYDHKIYCTPDIQKCLENLDNLKNFLAYDFEVTKEISEHIYHEYNLVIDYTYLSLRMILTDEKEPVNIILDETEINFRK